MRFQLFFGLFALFVASIQALSAQVFRLPDQPGASENAVRLLEYRGQLFLVTSRHVYQKKKAGFELLYSAPATLRDAEIAGHTLWLGADDGLWQWTPDAGSAPRQTRLVRNGVTALAPGEKNGDLLVATAAEGAFTLRDTQVVRTWVLNTRIEDACTVGGYTWLGTEAGLLRISADSFVQKYAEEGVAGFEIPDNIVTHLFRAGPTTLAVVMPEALAFFPITKGVAPAHGEHFDFLGEHGNTVRDLAQRPGGDFVFCTDKGVLWLSGAFLNEPHRETASTEVYDNSKNPKARKLPLAALLPGETDAADNWDTAFFDAVGNLWLANSHAVARIPKKKLKGL